MSRDIYLFHDKHALLTKYIYKLLLVNEMLNIFQTRLTIRDIGILFITSSSLNYRSHSSDMISSYFAFLYSLLRGFIEV